MDGTNRNLRIAIATFTLLVGATTAASAGQLTLKNRFRSEQDQVAPAQYWTPERLRDARELSLEPAAGFFGQQELDADLEAEGNDEPHTEPGKPPSFRVRPNRHASLFDLDANAALPSTCGLESDLAMRVPDGARNDAVGTAGAHFSSTRVPQQVVAAYPYRTVGKLFFSIPGQGDFLCSAAVIKPRLVVTAGHCVHSGVPGTGAKGFYGNFLFIPSYRDGRAPFGVWSWNRVQVTPAWANGGGSFPNGADYALIELKDQSFSGTVRRIGEITGWLGFQTLGLARNHVRMLGYACNFDGAEKMHEVSAQSFRVVAPNCSEYGSDMAGGSSGGPWVQNFGELAVGQPNPGMNRVVGVTSYRYRDALYNVNGASIFDRRFVDLLAVACGRQSGNC